MFSQQQLNRLSSLPRGWASKLPQEKLQEFAKAFQPKLTKYIPHKPHPTQQYFLLRNDKREVLFGGAAGGGKSDALLMAALQYVDIPGYAAILFRRKFTDLSQPDALIPRSHEWLASTNAKYDRNLHEWKFPTGGVPATLKFGYIESENDKYQYQGAAFQFVGFDELTQFPALDYDYLHGRLRRPAGMNVPLRMRGSANPGGIGHEWVKAHFMDNAPQTGALFIPSKLEDNPSLDRAEYEKSLEAIRDPVLRAQLRHGDWTIRPAGKLFKREWFQVVDAVPEGLKWVRYWDMAATEEDKKKKNDPDWTAGAKVAVQKAKDGAQAIWIADVRRIRARPAGVESFVRNTAIEDGRNIPVWIEQEPGSSGVNVIDNYVRRILFGWNVRGDKVTGPKVERWRPLSSQAEAGNVHLLRGAWNSWWLEEANASPQEGVHDDGLDAVAGALDKLLFAPVEYSGGVTAERRA